MSKFLRFLNENKILSEIRDIDNNMDDETANTLLTVEELMMESSTKNSPFDPGDSINVLMDLDDEESDVTESETTDTLEKRRGAHRSSAEVRDQAAQYKMVPDNNPNGYSLMRKSSRFSSDERHKLESREEIEPIITQLNKSPKSLQFDFVDGVLKYRKVSDTGDITEWKSVSGRSKSKWIKALDNYLERTGSDMYLKWDVVTDKTGKEKFGDHILKNAEPLKQDTNNPNIKDPGSVDYVSLTKDDEATIIQILNKAGQKTKKDQSVYGYDYESGCFTKNGEPITDKKTMVDLVNRLNGGVKQSDHDKWEHFCFSKDGSKIGKKVGSFSLPPIESCAANVPCAHEGCYAVKSYGLYPQVGAIWDNNLALLNDGRYDQFVEEATTFIKKAGLTHFRWSVSGDVFSKEYLNAILKVVTNCSSTTFWLYTKFYNLFKGVSVPGNLTVILSAWGPFQPPEDMAKKFPVAFLYDEENPDPRYQPKGIQICPCTDGKDAHCDTCKICFSQLAEKNLAFKKH